LNYEIRKLFKIFVKKIMLLHGVTAHPVVPLVPFISNQSSGGIAVNLEKWINYEGEKVLCPCIPPRWLLLPSPD
jgi:hypothetical protein